MDKEKEFNEFYDEAIRLWGEDAQLRMCIEEMSELMKEICKFQRYTQIKGQATPEKINEVRESIIEETADVLNCVSQVARMFGKDKVQKVREEKVARTKKKIKEYCQEMGIVKTTLLYIVKDGKVLLGEKLRGFGKGLYNGVGGKVQEGEQIIEGMLRETKEEFGVFPKNYRHMGNIFYDEFKDGEKIYYDTSIFIADDYEGDLQTTDEMRPEWFDIENLPYSQMFGDDVYWLKEVLNGKRINAKFCFDNSFNLINKYIVFDK